MDAREYQITLPYPPSVNHYFAVVRGRKILSKNGRDYKTAVGIEVLKSGRPKVFDGRLEITLAVHCPDNRRRDLDNVQKSIFDALGSANVYSDDSQIDRIVVERMKNAKPGRVEVTIREIG